MHVYFTTEYRYKMTFVAHIDPGGVGMDHRQPGIGRL
jgi:hypothetical protein